MKSVIVSDMAKLILLFAVMSLLCSIGAAAETTLPPAQLVTQLQETLAMYGNDRAIGETLIATGDAALPALEEAIARDDTRVSSRLIYWIAGVPGDNATSLLVKIMGESTDAELVRSAIACIDNRVVRRDLTVQEKSVLLEIIAQGPSGRAKNAALVLGHCLTVPAAERVPTILTRFVKEIGIPARPNDNWDGSYVSPYVRNLNGYLRAFSYVGEPAIPFLHEFAREPGDLEVSKWLTIARGMAGDIDAAAALAQIIREDPDASTRAEATRAYARAAKEAAIPLLMELLDDPAVIPGPSVTLADGRVFGGACNDLYPVRIVAADALTNLGYHDQVLSHYRSAGSQTGQAAPDK